jgi:hypothetical protein
MKQCSTHGNVRRLDVQTGLRYTSSNWGPPSFNQKTIDGIAYLDMFQQFAIPQVETQSSCDRIALHLISAITVCSF